MNKVVLDASALIAFLRHEPGSEQVRPILAQAAISTVNLSEVLAKAAELPQGLEAAIVALRGLQLRVVAFDESQAERAASLRPITHALGLSLGDRCCLALAMIEKSPVMTTDREREKLDIGVEVQVIR